MTWYQALEHASLIASVLVCLLMFIDRNKAQKREVTFSGTPVDKKDFEKALQDNNEAHRDLFGRINSIREIAAAEVKQYEATASESRSRMHNEIADVRERLSGVEVNTELLSQRLVQVDGKIDRLIERKK